MNLDVKAKKHLDGEFLCNRLHVLMYQRIVIQRKSSGQIFGVEHGKYFISPLGVAVVCSDGEGLFETNFGKELLERTCVIYSVYDEFISHKKVRFNKRWTKELSSEAGFYVRTKAADPVGAMKVPAVRFKKLQYKKEEQ